MLREGCGSDGQGEGNRRAGSTHRGFRRGKVGSIILMVGTSPPQRFGRGGLALIARSLVSGMIYGCNEDIKTSILLPNG